MLILEWLLVYPHSASNRGQAFRVWDCECYGLVSPPIWNCCEKASAPDDLPTSSHNTCWSLHVTTNRGKSHWQTSGAGV